MSYPFLAMEEGSSPLARGLRRHDRGDHLGHGIIPARAGFTNPSAFEKGIGRDHPRSRGVYPRAPMTMFMVAGSSPLARGLLHHRHGLPGRLGIIPARAGFTPPAGSPATSARDHPRSRGVYMPEIGCRLTVEGSSPLARGLLSDGDRGSPHGGIIPARAGFT